MIRTASSMLLSAGQITEAPDSAQWRDEIHMDQVIAGLAVAFAHDVELGHAPEATVLEKWPAGWTVAFVVLSSMVLWGGIAAVATLVI